LPGTIHEVKANLKRRTARPPFKNSSVVFNCIHSLIVMGIDCAKFRLAPSTGSESAAVEMATVETRSRRWIVHFRKSDESRRAFDGMSKFRHLNMSGLSKPIGVRAEWAASGGLPIGGKELDPIRNAQRLGTPCRLA
jgi:hypothetical protein